jgi:hypothetical protein
MNRMSEREAAVVELPWAADCCPCVDKLRTVLPLTVGIRDSAVQLVLTHQRVRTCSGERVCTCSGERVRTGRGLVGFRFPAAPGGEQQSVATAQAARGWAHHPADTSRS